MPLRRESRGFPPIGVLLATPERSVGVTSIAQQLRLEDARGEPLSCETIPPLEGEGSRELRALFDLLPVAHFASDQPLLTEGMCHMLRGAKIARGPN